MRDGDPESTPPKTLSRASLRGLDWFTFFVADIQTGFGPFLSVYLTTQKWNQADIGLVLSIGSIAALLGQLPGGWVVDVVRNKQRAAVLAVVAIGASALLIALWPAFAVIVLAKLLHVGASSVLGPAIAAITLGFVGYAALGPRLGRNASFAAVGNGVAAAVMGACGYFISAQAVFYVTAVLTIPTVMALLQVRSGEAAPLCADGGVASNRTGEPMIGVAQLLRSRGLIVLAVCVMLFHAANAALLPLVGSQMTMQSGSWATVLIAACIVVPQLAVALISPAIGTLANTWGRRPLLLIGFGALPLRAALLASTSDPYVIVVVQLLDGISGAALGVLVPLVLADVARGTGRFNLAQGIVGSMIGIGAAISTILAGRLADAFGMATAFAALALMAVAAFLVLLACMPETKPAGGAIGP